MNGHSGLWVGTQERNSRKGLILYSILNIVSRIPVFKVKCSCPCQVSLHEVINWSLGLSSVVADKNTEYIVMVYSRVIQYLACVIVNGMAELLGVTVR